MKERKRSFAALAAMVVLAMGAVGAWAADPDTGSFTVRITPNLDYGISVNTTGSKWSGAADLDVTMDLGSDDLLEVPVAVTILGNFSNQEMLVSAAANNTWVLDTDEVDAVDQLRLYALFGRSAYAGSPSAGTFSGTNNLLTTTPTRAGQSQANETSDTGHAYELATAATEYADVDGMAVSAVRRMWLRAHTPSTSSTDQQQQFTVTVTAVSGSGA